MLSLKDYAVRRYGTEDLGYFFDTPTYYGDSIAADNPKAHLAPFMSQQTFANWDGGESRQWMFDDTGYAAKLAELEAAVRAAGDSSWSEYDKASDLLSMTHLGIVPSRTVWDNPQYARGLAEALGLKPNDYNDFVTSLNDNNDNPFVKQQVIIDSLIGKYNLGSNPEVTAWRQQLQSALDEGGEAWVSRANNSDMTGWSGIMNVLKGAGFVAGSLGAFSGLGALAGADVATMGAGALGIEGGGFGLGANSLWGSAATELGLGGNAPSAWDFGPGNMGDGLQSGFDQIGNASADYWEQMGRVAGESGWDFGPGNMGDGFTSGFDQVGDMGRPAYDQMMQQVANGADPASFDWGKLRQGVQSVYDLVSPFFEMGAGSGGDQGGNEGYRTETLAAEDALFANKKFGRSPALMPGADFDTFSIGNPGLWIP